MDKMGLKRLSKPSTLMRPSKPERAMEMRLRPGILVDILSAWTISGLNETVTYPPPTAPKRPGMRLFKTVRRGVMAASMVVVRVVVRPRGPKTPTRDYRGCSVAVHRAWVN